MTITTQPVQDRTSEALSLITTWSQEEPQTLVSRRLVIDRLLDLRNAVDAAARFDIDSILADVPGVTVVEGSWWELQLANLETRLAAPEAGIPS